MYHVLTIGVCSPVQRKRRSNRTAAASAQQDRETASLEASLRQQNQQAAGFAGWCLWVPLCAPDKPASPLTRRSKSPPSTASTPPLSCKPTLRRRTPLRLAAAGGAALPAKRLGSLARPAQCAPGAASRRRCRPFPIPPHTSARARRATSLRRRQHDVSGVWSLASWCGTVRRVGPRGHPGGPKKGTTV